jgi:hypothetical protein
LPHRYPFLLVDKILELEPGRRAVGQKNVTRNEYFFQGHFPGLSGDAGGPHGGSPGPGGGGGPAPMEETGAKSPSLPELRSCASRGRWFRGMYPAAGDGGPAGEGAHGPGAGDRHGGGGNRCQGRICFFTWPPAGKTDGDTRQLCLIIFV